MQLVNTLGLINDKGPNPPREGHLSRAELNVKLRGPGFESTGKPVITCDHKIKIKNCLKSFSPSPSPKHQCSVACPSVA